VTRVAGVEVLISHRGTKEQLRAITHLPAARIAISALAANFLKHADRHGYHLTKYQVFVEFKPQPNNTYTVLVAAKNQQPPAHQLHYVASCDAALTITGGDYTPA
jgi:hypothetical protein